MIFKDNLLFKHHSATLPPLMQPQRGCISLPIHTDSRKWKDSQRVGQSSHHTGKSTNRLSVKTLSTKKI